MGLDPLTVERRRSLALVRSVSCELPCRFQLTTPFQKKTKSHLPPYDPFLQGRLVPNEKFDACPLSHLHGNLATPSGETAR